MEMIFAYFPSPYIHEISAFLVWIYGDETNDMEMGK
jgi:hypothetical protein